MVRVSLNEKKALINKILDEYEEYGTPIVKICKDNGTSYTIFRKYLNHIDKSYKEKYIRIKYQNVEDTTDDIIENANAALLQCIKDNNIIAIKYALDSDLLTKYNIFNLIKSMMDGLQDGVADLSESQYEILMDYLNKKGQEYLENMRSKG